MNLTFSTSVTPFDHTSSNNEIICYEKFGTIIYVDDECKKIFSIEN